VVGVVGDDVPVPVLGLDPNPELGCDPYPELGVEPKPVLGCEPKPVPVPFVPVPEFIDPADPRLPLPDAVAGPPPNILTLAFNCSIRGS
jgi:hypothetical protein